MNYNSFNALKEKPHGKTCGASPINGTAPLDFDPSLELLDMFSSFGDLMSGIGIEESWADEFPAIFPSFQPLASIDMSAVEEFDSYDEFLLLVDTAGEGAPVYFFSAEWWNWDEWEKNHNGFYKLFSTFDEFYNSLTDYQGDE